MHSEIKSRIDLLVENYEALRLRFMADSKFLNHFSSLVHASNDRKVDIAALKKIRAAMKEDTGIFSFFRGINESILMSFLYFEEDYNNSIKNTLSVYEKVKSNGISRSNYMPIAAYNIAKEVPSKSYDYTIKRMKEFYNAIKKGNYWNTNAKDFVFLALLAVTDLEVEKASKMVQYYYNNLKSIGLPKGTELQLLSYILTILGGESEKIFKNIINICSEFKEKNLKLGRYVIPSLGILAFINADISEVAQEIKEANEYLKRKKGYGFFGLSNDMRMLLIVSLICHIYLEKEESFTNETEIIAVAKRQLIMSAATNIIIAAGPSNG